MAATNAYVTCNTVQPGEYRVSGFEMLKVSMIEKASLVPIGSRGTTAVDRHTGADCYQFSMSRPLLSVTPLQVLLSV